MGSFIQILVLIISGIVLLWFGYTLFFGTFSPFPSGLFSGKSNKNFYKNHRYNETVIGDPQVCPVCSIKLEHGEMVKTHAFPSLSGGKDRLMYIRGCYNCLENDIPRKCPICGMDLRVKDYLVSRMFERAKTRGHVHVLGCNYCRRTGSLV